MHATTTLQFLNLHAVRLFRTIYYFSKKCVFAYVSSDEVLFRFCQLLCLLLVQFYLLRFYTPDIKCPQNINAVDLD